MEEIDQKLIGLVNDQENLNKTSSVQTNELQGLKDSLSKRTLADLQKIEQRKLSLTLNLKKINSVERRNPDQHKQPAEEHSSPKNKNRRYQSERQEEADRRADEAYEILQTVSQQDEFFIFGQHVANKLRKLSSTSYQIAKNCINQILFDAAMRKFEPDVGRFASAMGRSESFVPSSILCQPPLSSSHSAPDSFSCLSAPAQSHNPQTNDLPPSDQSPTQFSDQHLLTISTDIGTADDLQTM